MYQGKSTVDRDSKIKHSQKCQVPILKRIRIGRVFKDIWRKFILAIVSAETLGLVIEKGALQPLGNCPPASGPVLLNLLDSVLSVFSQTNWIIKLMPR